MNKILAIIGGGFGGVYSARFLQKRLPADWQIVLFSQENHFIFTPLLGDVVGSSINPMHVVCPIRQMARRAICRTAVVQKIDLQAHELLYQTAVGGLARQRYDQLVLACGSVGNLDIIPGMAAHGWPLKTMGDALMLRNHLIGQLERAEVEPSPEERRRLLAVAVVGAGYSGVEVAGEISDLLRSSARFYRNITAGEIKVTLLEGRDRILPELPEKLSSFAQRKMTKRGIDIRLQAPAHSVTERGLRLRDGLEIPAGTVVCTIGTTSNPLIAALGLPMTFHRLNTGPDMRVAGHPNLWAIGDCGAVPNAHDGKLASPTAQVAVRQASQLADNILCVLRDQPTRPFSFKPLGMLASIGGHKAVGLVFGLRISGFLAWFIWRGVYLSKMPTLSRKIQIAFDWAWQLFFPRDIAQLNLGLTERLGRAHFEPGQFVFRKGERGNRFYMIERGRAGVYLDETRPAVAELQAGDHFGEGALLRDAPRSASIKAEERLDVLILHKDSFGRLTSHMDMLRRSLARGVEGNRAAASLLDDARTDPRLNSVKVAEVMCHPVTTLPSKLTLGEALGEARAQGKGAYPVVDQTGAMVGICTRTDFYRAIRKTPTTPLSEIMTTPVRVVRASENLTAALFLFLREPIKRLVVVADDDLSKPVGMLTPFDVLQVVEAPIPDQTAMPRSLLHTEDKEIRSPTPLSTSRL